MQVSLNSKSILANEVWDWCLDKFINRVLNFSFHTNRKLYFGLDGEGSELFSILEKSSTCTKSMEWDIFELEKWVVVIYSIGSKCWLWYGFCKGISYNQL